MARANLLLSAELERAFADAQSGKLRFVKVSIEGESFVLSAAGPASSEPRNDVEQLVTSNLNAEQAAFVLLCPDTNVAALRWVLLAFVPESVSVRDRMLYSSSRDSLKKQLGLNYFSGEFHATELSEVTWASFLEARKKQAADAPLSESERLLKEAALLERDTNVKSSAMGVVPFEITQNVRDKLRLLQDNKFDWIAMKLSEDNESVEVVKSLENVQLIDVPTTLDRRSPSFVAYRYRAGATSALIFMYVCPEDSPVRLKMVYSTCKATVLSVANEELHIKFDHTIEINNPSSAVDDIRSELAPKTEEELKPREFARPAAPGRGRGRGRGRGPPGSK
ncbi:Cofilin/tropomyosin-type actin-binding protein [Phytophthora infestans]|uniref:Cofilin/tropomyosin-type actin-binding protein n=1 Tax=Phytophthora infestans TaxID=4787 RepID=A0A833SWK7_PHYIN|nr:Cofilin/tropomyosin-type actin-binding protein [Phytophthora infestans]KAF4149254.1 Cofilin/tropomyosin-type actin-binding protein [Phytophthora infestans]